jgi:HEAT repeat protein
MFTPTPLRRTLAAAIRDLSSQKDEVRASAARDLAVAGQDDAVAAGEALVAVLGDASAAVRAEAVLALGAIGARSSIDDVAKLVDDSQTMVRQYAVLALAQLGGDRARELLDDAWKRSEPDVRFQALLGMAMVDPKRALDLCLESAGDDDSWVASEAALQLGQLFVEEHGDGMAAWATEADRARAREKLRGLLAAASSRVALCAAMALARLDDERGRDVIVRFVKRESALEASDDENDLRAEAIEQLGRVGGDAARAALEPIAWRMLPSVDRELARAALARMGDARACAMVVEKLGSRWAAQRQTGVALAMSGRVVQAVPILIELLRTGGADAASVVAALAVMPDARAKDALAEYAKSGKDEDAREAARRSAQAE